MPYVDPFGREHKYPPPANWVTPDGVQSLGPAEWDELCARGLHFEPYTGTDATLCGIRGDCLFPLLEAGRHMIVTRPFREGESLIDGGLYVIAWDDDDEVAAYRARMGLPPDEPIEIVKFLRYIGFEWRSFCKDSSAELNGTVTAVVVGVVTIESPPQFEAKSVHAFQSFTDRDTGQLGANAATSIVNVAIASTGNVTVHGSPFYYINFGSITVPAFNTPTSLVFTVTGVGVLSTTDACELEVTFLPASTAPIPLTGSTTNLGSARIIVCTSPTTSLSGANTFSNSFAFEQYVTLPANTTATYYLWGLCAIGATPGDATSGTFNSINMKAEVVKR